MQEKDKLDNALEVICNICKYPCFLKQEELDAICLDCPAEKAINELLEAENEKHNAG